MYTCLVLHQSVSSWTFQSLYLFSDRKFVVPDWYTENERSTNKIHLYMKYVRLGYVIVLRRISDYGYITAPL